VKIAISCDSLVSRRYVTSIVEAVLSIYEDADIYTLIHKRKGILGPIEMRKIHSSYLTSVHQEIKDGHEFEEAFWRKCFLVPSAAHKLVIPCHYDVVINISSGLSHAIKKCHGVYQITYLLESLVRARSPRSWLEKIFHLYLDSWSKRQLKRADELWLPFSAEVIHANQKTLAPFIKLEDFPLFKEQQTKFFPKDFLTLDAPSMTLLQARDVVESLRRLEIKYCFIGEDAHLEELKENQGVAGADRRFFGNRCSGELAPMLAASRAHLTYKMTGFPDMAIQSLSVGVPAICLKGSDVNNFVKDDLRLTIRRLKDIKEAWQKLGDIAPIECHSFAKRYHEIKFKAEIRRRVERLNLKKESSPTEEAI
jgi:hypothetical protein